MPLKFYWDLVSGFGGKNAHVRLDFSLGKHLSGFIQMYNYNHLISIEPAGHKRIINLSTEMILNKS